MKKSELSDNIDKLSGLVSISQAADILGVSIDTVRRWDKSGILKSTRPDGKNRYFSVDELERIKFSQPLSISEAADRLEISTSTLRRLEDKGLITPARNSSGERVYDRDTLQEFFDSKYFMRQKSIEQEVLDPLSRHGLSEHDGRHVGHDPVAQVMLTEQKKSVHKLHKFRKISLTTILLAADAFILLVTTISSLFVLLPDSTSKALGYYKQSGINRQFPMRVTSSLLAQELKPFSELALNFIGAINPQMRLRIFPPQAIHDVNDVFSPDGKGSILSKYIFTVANSSYLKIPDQGLVANLNSDLLQGRHPGQDVGDLAILPLDTNQIKDGSVTLSKLSPGALSYSIV